MKKKKRVLQEPFLFCSIQTVYLSQLGARALLIHPAQEQDESTAHQVRDSR